MGLPAWASATPVNDDAATVAKPPIITDRLLNISICSRGFIPRAEYVRRGQGGEAGGTSLTALMPEAEIADMIVEIRSVTQGVGTYRTEFDHLQELVGRTAERIVEETKKRAAA